MLHSISKIQSFLRSEQRPSGYSAWSRVVIMLSHRQSSVVQQEVTSYRIAQKSSRAIHARSEFKTFGDCNKCMARVHRIKCITRTKLSFDRIQRQGQQKVLSLQQRANPLIIFQAVELAQTTRQVALNEQEVQAKRMIFMLKLIPCKSSYSLSIFKITLSHQMEEETRPQPLKNTYSSAR